jgi:hypothetical protein
MYGGIALRRGYTVYEGAFFSSYHSVATPQKYIIQVYGLSLPPSGSDIP